jgi:hypothetical protein
MFNRGVISLLVLLLGLGIYFYKDNIKEFPSHIHAWSQADRYALALGFIDSHFDFFHPRTFNLHPHEEYRVTGKDGITAVDFPIHDYIAAAIMKVTGHKAPGVFRLYILLYSMAGLCFLFLFMLELSGSILKSLFLVVFVFTAPVFTYYQDGFMPTIPSIANVFISWYFYQKYLNGKNIKELNFSIVFITLAALARTPFIMFLTALLMQEAFRIYYKKGNFKPLRHFVPAYCLIAFYFLYNMHLRAIYGSSFLNKLCPPKNFHDFKELFTGALHNWGEQYFGELQWILFAMGGLYFLWCLARKLIPAYTLFLTLQGCIILVGASCYFVLMEQQFIAHDYYFLDSFFPGLVLLMATFIAILPAKVKLKWLWIIFGIAICFGFIINTANMQEKRKETGTWDGNGISIRNFEGAERFLDSIQIPKTAKILVLGAYSTNIPLILMNRKGYTLLTTARNAQNEGLKWDFDYIVIENYLRLIDITRENPDIITRLQFVASNERISLYKLMPANRKQTLSAFLGLDKKHCLLNQFIDFSRPEKGLWSNTDNLDSHSYYSAPSSAYMNEQMEFGTTLSIFYEQLSSSAGPFQIVVSFYIKPSSKLHELNLACTLGKNGKDHFTNYFYLSDYVKGTGWQKQGFLFNVPKCTPGDELKVYFYNPGRNSFNYDDLEISIY